MPLVKRSNDPTKGEKKSTVDKAVGDQQVRMQLISEAISELEEDDYTAGGLPKIEVLETLTGFSDITAKERDDAYAAHYESVNP